MSLQLISHSLDLQRLRNDGYTIEIVGPYLAVRDIPYVRGDKQVCKGTFVCELTLAGNQTAPPSNHVMFFEGEMPCDQNGVPIEKIRHSDADQQLAPGLFVNRSFSSKPVGDEGQHRQYIDYYEKVATYAAMLGNPARCLDPEATACIFAPVEDRENETVHVYLDTASSRSEILMIAAKLSSDRIGIIGLGGTGAYILDLVAKTHVGEIQLFDGDQFLSHNAFRSPGSASIEDVTEKPLKSEYFKNMYKRMHKKLVSNPVYINKSNLNLLDGLDFVFIAIDSGEARRLIVDYLLEMKTPFIDVGMGILRRGDTLAGQIRTTLVTATTNNHVATRIPMHARGVEDEYASNIQVADLNALNAALAVLKWKRFRAIYADLEHEHHSIFDIDGNHVTNEECT